MKDRELNSLFSQLSDEREEAPLQEQPAEDYAKILEDLIELVENLEENYHSKEEQTPYSSGIQGIKGGADDLPSDIKPTWEGVCKDIGWDSSEAESGEWQTCSSSNLEQKNHVESRFQTELVKERKKLDSVISNILFYFILLCVIFGVFIFSSQESSPRNVLGYGYFTVLSGSMQSVIPKGSLVITKQTDPNSIQVGDDITFFKDEKTTITHRVIEIYENYMESGERGFKTKGTENPAPDKNIVAAKNVIGVVKFSFYGVGDVLSYVKTNFLLVAIILAMLMLLITCIRIFIENGEQKLVSKNPEETL